MKPYILLLVFSFIGISLKAQSQNAKIDSALIEYYQSQKYAEAADLLSKSYPEPVSNPKIIAQLAYTYKMANKLPQAQAYYERLYSADSTNLPVLFSLATINSQRGKNQAAMGFYKKILVVDSTNFNVYKQLGMMSGAKGDIPSEIKYLQKANSLNPTDPDIAFDLSNILIGFKQLPQAQKVIDGALKADTANLLLLKGKAQISYALQQYAETVAICDKLLANFDHSNQVVTYKGVAEYNLKKYKDCIKTFSLLDSANTQSETSFYYMGISYKELNDNNKAIYYLQKAIDQAISSNTDDYYNEIADSYEKLHLPKKAVAAYQRALTFNEKPLAIYSLAAVYDTNLRDTLNALKYYKKYLRTKPPIEKQRNYIDYSTRRIADLSR